MTFNIISFNIRCCDDFIENTIKKRSGRLSHVCGLYCADIIGFQEYTPKWKEYIEKYYGKDYEIYTKQRAANDGEGLVILWKKERFACEDSGCFWLSDTPNTESKGWDERYHKHRICTYALLRDKASGEKIAFFNTHFGFGENGQIKSVGLICEKSKEISEYPTVLVGDFNMTPQSGGYKEAVKHFTDVNAVTARDFRPTYHGYVPQNVTDQHIDYCFIGEKVTPLEYKIIDDTVEGKFPSDHFGIHVRLEA